MSHTADLVSLAAIYGELSLLAVGGGNTVLPEMQRQVVHVHGWMTAPQFAALYALAQASPGPNMLVSTLVGWRVAGLAGALVATLSLTMPSCALTLCTAHFWYRFRHAPWRRRVQWSLVPLTVGLLLAGAAVLCEATTVDWQTAALTLVVAGGDAADDAQSAVVDGGGGGFGSDRRSLRNQGQGQSPRPCCLTGRSGSAHPASTARGSDPAPAQPAPPLPRHRTAGSASGSTPPTHSRSPGAARRRSRGHR